MSDIRNIQKQVTNSVEEYKLNRFNKEVFGTDANKLLEILKFKKNLILQGAPGVGKTYTARRIAYLLMGRKDDSHIAQVQFHQSYTYEDFIMGLRPTPQGGFRLEKGVFYKLCEQARGKKTPYFMIIDEINRGNISMILGETFSLMENEYRGKPIRLKYNGEAFDIPNNVYIIGTMNTADRGLVALDYALRRRFSFYTVEPAFESDGFYDIINRNGNIKLNKLIKRIRELNKVISEDEMLGEGFKIGHSYFCTKEVLTEKDIRNIVEYDIIPLISEYWYDDPDKKGIEWGERLLEVLD